MRYAPGGESASSKLLRDFQYRMDAGTLETDPTLVAISGRRGRHVICTFAGVTGTSDGKGEIDVVPRLESSTELHPLSAYHIIIRSFTFAFKLVREGARVTGLAKIHQVQMLEIGESGDLLENRRPAPFGKVRIFQSQMPDFLETSHDFRERCHIGGKASQVQASQLWKVCVR